jgi:hypothetical protein
VGLLDACAAGGYFSCLAKRSNQEKARLRRRSAAPTSLCCSPWGRAAELAPFAARTALTQPRRVRSGGAARRPQGCAARHLRRHRPRREAGALMAQRVCFCSCFGFGFGFGFGGSFCLCPWCCVLMLAGCRRPLPSKAPSSAAEGWRAQRASLSDSPRLSERSARSARSELRGAPLGEQRRAPAGRLRRRDFLCLLSLARQRK